MPDTDFEYTKNLRNYFVDEDDYPNEHGYDWMSRAWGDGILDFFNSYDKRAQEYYQKHIDEPAMKDEWLALYDKTMTLLEGAKDILSVMHIMVERWSSDPDNPWILADKKDAKHYNDSLNDGDDTIKKDVKDYNFWPNPEGSRYTRSTQKIRYLSPKDYPYNDSVTEQKNRFDTSTTPKLTYSSALGGWVDDKTGVVYKDGGGNAHNGVFRDSHNPYTTKTDSLPSFRSIGV